MHVGTGHRDSVILQLMSAPFVSIALVIEEFIAMGAWRNAAHLALLVNEFLFLLRDMSDGWMGITKSPLLTGGKIRVPLSHLAFDLENFPLTVLQPLATLTRMALSERKTAPDSSVFFGLLRLVSAVHYLYVCIHRHAPLPAHELEDVLFLGPGNVRQWFLSTFSLPSMTFTERATTLVHYALLMRTFDCILRRGEAILAGSIALHRALGASDDQGLHASLDDISRCHNLFHSGYATALNHATPEQRNDSLNMILQLIGCPPAFHWTASASDSLEFSSKDWTLDLQLGVLRSSGGTVAQVLPPLIEKNPCCSDLFGANPMACARLLDQCVVYEVEDPQGYQVVCWEERSHTWEFISAAIHMDPARQHMALGANTKYVAIDTKDWKGQVATVMGRIREQVFSGECAKFHPMRKLVSTPYSGGYICDICRTHFSQSATTPVMHCKQCHFDVCHRCIPKYLENQQASCDTLWFHHESKDDDVIRFALVVTPSVWPQKLAAFRGRKTVVCFLPFAFTGG